MLCSPRNRLRRYVLEAVTSSKPFETTKPDSASLVDFQKLSSHMRLYCVRHAAFGRSDHIHMLRKTRSTLNDATLRHALGQMDVVARSLRQALTPYKWPMHGIRSMYSLTENLLVRYELGGGRKGVNDDDDERRDCSSQHYAIHV